MATSFAPNTWEEYDFRYADVRQQRLDDANSWNRPPGPPLPPSPPHVYRHVPLDARTCENILTEVSLCQLRPGDPTPAERLPKSFLDKVVRPSLAQAQGVFGSALSTGEAGPALDRLAPATFAPGTRRYGTQGESLYFKIPTGERLEYARLHPPAGHPGPIYIEIPARWPDGGESSSFPLELARREVARLRWTENPELQSIVWLEPDQQSCACCPPEPA